MAAPLVSIVTPAYNAAPFIAETAQSLLAQTHANWEWIVADDGSTDATRDIVASFADPRIRILAGEHAGLPAVGRNRAIAVARGDYVAFVDADDCWLPEKLASQLAAFDLHPEAGLVFSQMIRVNRRPFPPLSVVPNPDMMFSRLCLDNFIPNSSVIVRRSLLDAAGPLDEDPRLRGTEDYELWLRLAPLAPFFFLPMPLVEYRIHAGALSASAVAITRGRIAALEKALSRVPGGLPLERSELESWKRFWLGQAQFTDGEAGYGRDSFRDALRMNRRNWRAWKWLAASFAAPLLSAQRRRALTS